MGKYTTAIQFIGLSHNLGTSHLAYTFSQILAVHMNRTLYISTNENKLNRVFEFPSYLILKGTSSREINLNSFSLNRLYQMQLNNPQSVVSKYYYRIQKFPLAHLIIDTNKITSSKLNKILLKLASKFFYDYIIIDYHLPLNIAQIFNFCSLQNPSDIENMLQVRSKFNSQITNYILMRYHDDVIFNISEIQKTLKIERQAINDDSLFQIPDIPEFILNQEYYGFPFVVFNSSNKIPKIINNQFYNYRNAIGKIYNKEIIK